ncbi:MAG: heavy-metal-associated domain-containing protein [Flavobacteriaceae bacterium]|jgi:copper chaperone CopZ|uniref:heavy-metal-associated domain-containing protein n=1 Tax=Flagellimonas TaxID=444459 RepID=UPI000E25FEFD|nr:heavy-metal-associated domain-containing protein [Allomuricauda sp.]MCR9263402.1 heavy-metal-associated domain-containing protein [Flavobacteriaceae bacterium]
MKTILFAVFTVMLVSIGHGQEKNKSVTFEIKGNCGMCKNRIEKAAIKIKGVKFTSWNADTKEFHAIIDERKCSISDIKKRIAEVGHDSEGFTAPDEVYDNLPECCKYRDPASIHMDHGKH